MQAGHDILDQPLPVTVTGGIIDVLKLRGNGRDQWGESTSLDSIVNSIDGEIVARGPDGKGLIRGAITRQGPYTLWGFEGFATDMTTDGMALFVNTCFYATKHANSRALEQKLNETRGSFYFLNPDGPYKRIVRPTYMTFETDTLAKSLGIPNHKKAYLEQLIQDLPDAASQAALEHYTLITTFGSSKSAWQGWYNENKDYLWFSECESFKWKIDGEAKLLGIPTETLRGWSSEDADYRT